MIKRIKDFSNRITTFVKAMKKIEHNQKLADKVPYLDKRLAETSTLLSVRIDQINALSRERDMFRDRETKLRERIYSLETKSKYFEEELKKSKAVSVRRQVGSKESEGKKDGKTKKK